MKKTTIRRMLAVMGLTAALTGCGLFNEKPAAENENTVEEEYIDVDPDDSADDAGEDDSSADAGDDDRIPDAGDDDQGSGENDQAKDFKKLAAPDDGVYVAVDYLDPERDYDAEETGALYQASINDGILNITASFEEADFGDGDDEKAYYEFGNRELKVSDDLVIGFSGEEGIEPTTVDVFNEFYADPEAEGRDGHVGLGVMFEITDGEVTAITIGS